MTLFNLKLNKHSWHRKLNQNKIKSHFSQNYNSTMSSLIINLNFHLLLGAVLIVGFEMNSLEISRGCVASRIVSVDASALTLHCEYRGPKHNEA